MNDDSTVRRRLLIGLAFLFVATAAFSHLYRTYAQKFFDVTGRAQWIWARHRMSANVPVAFFASRDFDLPEHRIYTHLKVLGDPEYTLYVNGREIAGRQVAADNRVLDLFDISELVRHRGNRIVIAVRSPQGVGGLIASIDIAPETENWIVTDGSWKIHRRWSPDILVRDPRDGQWEGPMIIGQPPIGRWNYLALARRKPNVTTGMAAAPREAMSMVGLLPKIKTQTGVTFAVVEEAPATAFDFGFTKGRVRLSIESDSFVSRTVNVRFANARQELEVVEWKMRPVVFAPGERVVTTPESYDFRYLMVFGRRVKAEVVK